MRKNNKTVLLGSLVGIFILAFGLWFYMNPLKKIDTIPNMARIEDIISIEEIDITSEYDDMVAYKIFYKSDECKVAGYITAPKDYLENDYPIVIFNRGGNQNIGKVSVMDIVPFSQYDYITLISQYRGVDGGNGKDEYGGADVQDVIKLIDFAETFTFANTERIYMHGFSRGGLMTYLVLKQDDRIKAAAVVSGPVDMKLVFKDGSTRLQQVLRTSIGNSPISLPEEYEKRSAINWVEEINTPLFVIHSKNDPTVDGYSVDKFVKMMQESGKEIEYLRYDDDVHGFHQGDTARIFEWYEQHVD